MNSIIDTILAYIQKFFEWVVSSGLAEKTADAFAKIISFDGWELDTTVELNTANNHTARFTFVVEF